MLYIPIVNSPTRGLAGSTNKVFRAYHIMGNSHGRKHSQFENWKLVTEKIFANDKSFNLFLCEN